MSPAPPLLTLIDYDPVVYVLTECAHILLNSCRQDDLIEVTHQALQYMILIEFDYPLASLVVIALRELFSMMTRVREETERASQRGLKLEEQQLCFFIERGFRVKDIAGIFSCSRQTIERRLLELGM